MFHALQKVAVIFRRFRRVLGESQVVDDGRRPEGDVARALAPGHGHLVIDVAVPLVAQRVHVGHRLARRPGVAHQLHPGGLEHAYYRNHIHFVCRTRRRSLYDLGNAGEL